MALPSEDGVGYLQVSRSFFWLGWLWQEPANLRSCSVPRDPSQSSHYTLQPPGSVSARPLMHPDT